MSTLTTVTFGEVKMRRKLRVCCPDCGKARKKVISRSYYRNGFHNELDTRDKYNLELDKEEERLITHGLICSQCEDKDVVSTPTFYLKSFKEGDIFSYGGEIYKVKQDCHDIKRPWQIPCTSYHAHIDPLTLKPSDIVTTSGIVFSFREASMKEDRFGDFVVYRNGVQIFPTSHL